MRILTVCVMCRKRIEGNKVTARQIDGLWLCSTVCKDNFLNEKKKWTPARWDELCQLLSEEHQCLCSRTT